MTELLKFSKVGAEDINFGTGTFEVELSDGRRAAISQVNLTHFISPVAVDTAIYFTNGSTIGQDSLFTYDTATSQMTMGAATSIRVGSSGTALDEMHVAVDGQASIRIENTGTNIGDMSLVYAKNGTAAFNISVDDDASDRLVIAEGAAPSGTPYLTFIPGDTAIVAGTNTPNSFSTAGVTIFQGTNDDECLTLKSSDITHGVTTATDTNTYALMKKENATSGGLELAGYTEDEIATNISGVATNSDSTRSAAGTAPIVLSSLVKSGTSTTTFVANENIFCVRNGTGTVMIVTGDGDIHVDGLGTLTTFDGHDDIKLLEAIKSIGTPNYKEQLGRWVDNHLNILEQGGVITRQDGSCFISTKGLNGLFVDAIRQLSARLEAVESR